MPVCFCEIDAGWASIVCSSFDPVHVLVSWKMVVCKFHNEDFGAVLQSVKGFAWNIPVDGFEGVLLGPVVLFHELLAKSWLLAACPTRCANRCVIVFTIDSETGFGGWNEGDGLGAVMSLLLQIFFSFQRERLKRLILFYHRSRHRG